MSFTVIGNWNDLAAGHPKNYFSERYTFMDFRGDLLISPLSHWGYENMIITLTHDISPGRYTEDLIMKSVRVDDWAWITSRCILYNCHIGHHAILAIGAVVANMDVEPWTIVAGNPAKVVARWSDSKWTRV